MINATEFGRRLKYYLREHEIKYIDFAKSLGKSQQTLTNWIQGVAEPQTSICMKIIERYDVDARWLFYGITKSRDIVEDQLPEYNTTSIYLKEIIRAKNDLIKAQQISIKHQEAIIKRLENELKKNRSGT